MDPTNDTACPVCTLYLRPGITLESHLNSHPKQKVIEALIRASQRDPISVDTGPKIVNQALQQPPQHPMTFVSPNINSQMTPSPPNHSFIYQQFMSSSAHSQPMLNVAPNQQFVAVPTVFNPPQMYCSPYIIQQQQQVILSANGAAAAAANFQSFSPGPNPAICLPSGATITEITDPLRISHTPSDLLTHESSVESIVETQNVCETKDDDSDKINLVQEPLKIVASCSSDITTNEKLINVNSSDAATSIPAGLEEDDDLKTQEISEDEARPDIIFETKNHEVVSVTIKHVELQSSIESPAAKELEEKEIDDEEKENESVHLDELMHAEDDEEELDKACQTVKECISGLAEVIVIKAEPENMGREVQDLSSAIQNMGNNSNIVVASSSGLQETTNNGMSVTVLEMDDFNFILQNDFVSTDESILPTINNDLNSNTKVSIDDQEYIINDVADDKFSTEKIDEESLSRESLNIRADERMPPRGELSEQESNGASEVGWGTRIYQEGSSGMSTSYDLLARESWEASDCSDSEMPPLQSRIQPASLNYKSDDDVDDPEPNSESPTFDFNCSTCGATFRCPKERRVHQAQEHSSPSNSSTSCVKKRQTRNSNRLKKEIVRQSQTPMVVKMELKSELSEVDTIALDNADNDFLLETKENVLCNLCGELLPSMKDWNIHNRKVHNIRPQNQNLVCRTCSETFLNQREYLEHLKEHPLECNICGKNFYKLPNLRLHLRRHTGIKPHKCDICTKSFFSKQKLQEHINVHSGSSPIKCTMCSETFRRYSNLVQHRNRHHLNIKRKIKDYVCFCGEIFHSKSKLSWHKEVHESKPKSCKYCHEKFVHMASLTRHIRRAHNQRYVPEMSREIENVECKVCNGVYLKSSLDAHLLTHTGTKQYGCPICSKQFTTKWNLKLHKWTHAAATSKPFKCDTCNAAFIRKSDYISHMNSHKSIRPYTCNYCGCKFIRKYNCLRHVREHEEGKAFICNVCNKSFHRSYYLKEHMRVHSGVRPFSCHICGKTSTTKSNHNKHMKIHHAREPVMTEG